MKLPSKNFCPAPFVHGYINANNRAHKLCCMSDIVGRFDGTKPLQDTFQQFWNGDTVKEIRQQFLNGEWPSACWYCKKHEEEGVYNESMRLQLLERYKDELDYDDLLVNVDTGNKYNKALDIDLRPGKLCNLKCRSCNTVWSDKIEKEVLANPQIQGKEWYWDTITTSKEHMKLVNSIDWESDDFDIVSSFDLSNVKWLKMSGGETLVDKRVIKMLNRVVESGHAKNIRLHLLTNGTVPPRKLFSILGAFEYVTINVSIDATHKLEEYLRTGTRWDQQNLVFKALFELENLKWLGVNSVFQVTNAFNLASWYSEVHELGLEYGGSKFKGINLLPLVDPMYLCVAWLDDDHKKLIEEQVQTLEQEFKDNERVLNSLKVVRKELQVNINRDKLRDEYVRHTVALDKIRNTNVLDYVPELRRYINGMA